MGAETCTERTPQTAPAAPGVHVAIDLDRYPIHERGQPNYGKAVKRARRSLVQEDCARLESFIKPNAMELLRAEAEELRSQAVYMSVEHNPYFSDPPDDAPDWDPRRRMGMRTNGMVPGDAFDRDGALWQIYRSREMRAFLEDCLETRPIHCYEDPLGCMVLSIQSAGQEFAWHFDTNEFAVTILIQRSKGGGQFEFAPNIRTADSECYEEVAGVLSGDSDRTRVLDLEPGDLQLFRGRHAVHRVTRVVGDKPRMIAVLAYSREAGVYATPERAMQAWGRVHPAQLEAAKRRRRADSLLD